VPQTAKQACCTKAHGKWYQGEQPAALALKPVLAQGQRNRSGPNPSCSPDREHRDYGVTGLRTQRFLAAEWPKRLNLDAKYVFPDYEDTSGDNTSGGETQDRPMFEPFDEAPGRPLEADRIARSSRKHWNKVVGHVLTFGRKPSRQDESWAQKTVTWFLRADAMLNDKGRIGEG